jgi:hypothetical protein
MAAFTYPHVWGSKSTGYPQNSITQSLKPGKDCRVIQAGWHGQGVSGQSGQTVVVNGDAP